LTIVIVIVITEEVAVINVRGRIVYLSTLMPMQTLLDACENMFGSLA